MLFRRRLACVFVAFCAAPLAFMPQSARTQSKIADPPAHPLVVKEKPHPIDAFYDACMEKNQSTSGMADCAGKANVLWDKQMNKDYTALLKASNAKTRAKLRDGQRAWLAYRDKEWAAQNELYNRDGTMWIPVRASLHMRLVKERALQMGDYLSDNEPR